MHTNNPETNYPTRPGL